MQDRFVQITRCMDELALCQQDLVHNAGMGAAIGQLDWLEELHYWLHMYDNSSFIDVTLSLVDSVLKEDNYDYDVHAGSLAIAA